MAKFWKKLKKAVEKVIAPNEIKCLVCGRDLFDGQIGFCDDCVKTIPFNNGKTCARCGVALHGEEEYCSHCAFEKVYFEKAYSAFSYDGEIKVLIVNVKFHNRAYIMRTFARYLVYLAQKNKLSYDIVTYVPMTKKSQKQRGYNQAQLLAEHFCDILGIEEPVSTLTKTRETAKQEKLSRIERQESLIGAFSSDKQIVKGKRILLVDDVKTTGATLNECAKALKKAGATEVICITVASREETFIFEREEEI